MFALVARAVAIKGSGVGETVVKIVIPVAVISACTVALVFGLRRVGERYFEPINLTVGDLTNLSDEIATSADQLQKAYDWTIGQWSAFGRALLAATLGFISACVIDLYKDSVEVPHIGVALVVGVGFSALLYVKCQVEIVRLRNEFVSVFTLLAELRR